MTTDTATPVYPSAYDLVLEFHTTYGLAIRSLDEAAADIPEKVLRVKLLREEMEEYAVAWGERDIVEMADALADSVYVAYGAAISHGVTNVDELRRQTVAQYHEEWGTVAATVPTAYHVDGLTGMVLFAGAQANYVSAVEAGSLSSVGHSLAEIIDVAYYVADLHGINLDAVLAEVQSSNMSKLGADGKPIYREGDGKVLKGPNFFEPRILEALIAQGYDPEAPTE